MRTPPSLIKKQRVSLRQALENLATTNPMHSIPDLYNTMSTDLEAQLGPLGASMVMSAIGGLQEGNAGRGLFKAAAFRLPNGKVVNTGLFHDLGALAESHLGSKYVQLIGRIRSLGKLGHGGEGQFEGLADGFITKEGKFVTRKEAEELAKKSGF